ncbi:hypothetical protein FN846DRAFT_626841 [Sphaerosporella brunnea]|uniref:Uncharacterized protein n=1 Tax=Sphaerosporella brunnea TaxID=1250544 RepID=A0A5J5ECG9_9PEZI|nr:hypothetical protein FN846DRAFT_626841 [Sphaerosporella brunnea]
MAVCTAGWHSPRRRERHCSVPYDLTIINKTLRIWKLQCSDTSERKGKTWRFAHLGSGSLRNTVTHCVGAGRCYYGRMAWGSVVDAGREKYDDPEPALTSYQRLRRRHVRLKAGTLWNPLFFFFFFFFFCFVQGVGGRASLAHCAAVGAGHVGDRRGVKGGQRFFFFFCLCYLVELLMS